MIAESGATKMTSLPSSASSSAAPTPSGTSTPPASSKSPAPSKAEPKPIKLRAACNHCFTAKVRCDGNKEGCRRCGEKKLSCVYSESRVGKVVGKRRKRPIDDSIGTINSQSWVVHNSVPIHSIPSPATTHVSDESTKRQQCNPPAWSPYVVGADPGFLTFEETTDSLSALDMADNRSYSIASDLSFFNSTGLPTPGLSPPQFTRYLSPAQLDARPISRQSSCPIDPMKLHPQRYATLPRHSDPSLEDEETVCIKLLAHLKKHSADESQPREMQFELLKKSNAAVRRILHSQAVRNDYSCHLLLSNIMNHLVQLCERLCRGRLDESQFLQEQIHFEGMPGFFDTPVPHNMQPVDQEQLESVVREVLVFTSVVGDFLKKKPIYGFQTLGRQETFHVELEHRLKKASASLQA